MHGDSIDFKPDQVSARSAENMKPLKENKILINNSETRVYPIILSEVKELICISWGDLILTTNLASVPSI